MEVFPENILVSYGLTVEEAHNFLITDFESGKEQRRKVSAFPLRKFNLPYKALQDTKIVDLWKFYRERNGAYDPFWFFFPVARNVYNEYVGRGGEATTFDLPGREVDKNTVNIYVNGEKWDFYFLQGGGAGGSDRFTFDAVAFEDTVDVEFKDGEYVTFPKIASPPDGAFITTDFKGKPRYKVRFAMDNLEYEIFSELLYTMGVELIEVRGN